MAAKQNEDAQPVSTAGKPAEEEASAVVLRTGGKAQLADGELEGVLQMPISTLNSQWQSSAAPGRKPLDLRGGLLWCQGHTSSQRNEIAGL